MWNYLTEKFITEYFLYQTVLGAYFNGQAVFELLSKIFLLSGGEKAFARGLIQSENISEVSTENDYMRYCRSKKYFEISGIETAVSPDEDVAITLKGTAIATAKAMGCTASTVTTRLKTEETLSAGAASGSIAAMRLVGLMLSEGIFFTRGKEEGTRYLRMAAAWNDVPSLMYSLYYDGAYTRRYAGKLGFLLRNAAHGEILPIIESVYGKYEGGEHKEAKLLERLFQLDVLQREAYSAPHARALFSRAVSYKDKEKLLYTAGKDYLPLVGDLPLKLGEVKDAAFDYGAFENIPLNRGEEQKNIIARLDNSDLRGVYSYRPLCVSSDSVYLLQMYADVIADCAANANVEYINVNALDVSRFEHNKNNIFIRSCDEDRENIYFMFFTGDIRDVTAEQAAGFLRSDGRSRFNLNMPNISLNLSYILPICFCDSKNEKYLRDLCDVIRVADCTESEKPKILQYILGEKSRLYGIPEIEIHDKLKKKLLSLDIDEMESELDVEVRGNRKKGERLVLTMDNYTAGSDSGSRYGFGGYKQ